MKRIKLIIAGLTAACSLLLAGCGGDNPITRSGMQEISNLNYSEALESFDKAQEAGENGRLIARGRGIAYLGQAKYSEAVECFLDALKLSNGFLQDIDYDINYYLASAYIGLGDYTAADDVYTSILALDENSGCYLLRGKVRLLDGNFTFAADDFNRAVSLAPKDVDLIIDIYDALVGAGYREAGLEYLDKALDSYETTMSSLNRGKIYYYKGEYQVAAVALEEARSADNNNSDATLYLGMTYEAVGEYNYATNVYENYLARNAGDAAVLNQLAVCKMELKDYEGALESIQAGLQVADDATRQSLSFNEIVIYEYLGEFQKAEALMTVYLNNYPGDEDALREQIFLKTR